MQEDGENMGTEDQAVLSNRDGFTVFRFGKYTIRFRAPYSLERYTEIKEISMGQASYTRNENDSKRVKAYAGTLLKKHEIHKAEV